MRRAGTLLIMLYICLFPSQVWQYAGLRACALCATCKHCLLVNPAPSGRGLVHHWVNMSTTDSACRHCARTVGLALCTRPCRHRTPIHSKGTSGSAATDSATSAGCSCSMAPHVACKIAGTSSGATADAYQQGYLTPAAERMYCTRAALPQHTTLSDAKRSASGSSRAITGLFQFRLWALLAGASNLGNHLHSMQRELVQRLIQVQQHCQRRRGGCRAEAAEQVNRALAVQCVLTALETPA